MSKLLCCAFKVVVVADTAGRAAVDTQGGSTQPSGALFSAFPTSEAFNHDAPQAGEGKSSGQLGGHRAGLGLP